MREYMNRLARGSFTYDRPQLTLEPQKFQTGITAGKKTEYEFQICSTDPVKGIIYSSLDNVRLKEHEFNGTVANIRFCVDADGYHAGDHIKGELLLISTSGEQSLEYDFEVLAESYETEGETITDLFQFALLAVKRPQEAAQLFESDTFRELFLKQDMALRSLYELLKKNQDVQLAMEEFLVAAKKKEPVTYTLEENQKEYHEFTESQKDVIALIRSGQGYSSLKITTDADFLIPERDLLTQEDFTGNRYELAYRIEKEKMHAGNNCGRILITSFNQTLVYEVNVHNVSMTCIHKDRKQAIVGLIREYLDFRMKRLDTAQWIEHTNHILDRIRGIEQDETLFSLIQAQMYFAQKRQEDGLWLLDHVKDQVMLSKGQNPELYAYYLYVNTLAIREQSYTDEVIGIIERYYEQGHDDFPMLWFLFYLDAPAFKNKSIRLTRMKDLYHDGCSSPIMYYEALSIFNKEPVLLRVLNHFELQVIRFGCKYQLISEDLAGHICDLIQNEKVAAPTYLKILNSLYEKYDSDEILTVLVTHLIRNELVGTEYVSLYEKGILRGLRITRLYEYYIMSLNQKEMPRLPKMVLMYFGYESQLAYGGKAYLYANIISNREQMPDILLKFDSQIEKFAYEQIRLGHVNDNLNIIYHYIWKEQMISEETAGFMNRYLFTCRINVFDDRIVNVIVKHKEICESSSYPVLNKVSFIPIYTEGAAIAFQYEDGTIRKGNVQYEMERLCTDISLLEQIQSYCQDDIWLILYRQEMARKNHSWEDSNALDCWMVMNYDGLEDWFKKQVNSWLINYYHDHYQGDEFQTIYAGITQKDLANHDAVLLTECCITDAMYEDAFDLIRSFGYSNVRTEKLILLARHMIEIYDHTEDELLTSVCEYLFESQKYEKEILFYLSRYYNGTNLKMYELWKACRNYDVDCFDLTERLIAQMVFTGEYKGHMAEVFHAYYECGGDPHVVEGYVAYHAFLYFVKNVKTDEIVFEVLEKNQIEDSNAPEICRLALLKHYSEIAAQGLSSEQKRLSQRILQNMCAEGKLFPFFRKFAGVLELPYHMVDQTVVEYHANPNHKVEIHYQISGELSTDRQEHIEVMKCATFGVFTKSFTLFYSEHLTYYFTEESNGEILKTEQASLEYDQMDLAHTDGRFEYINDMLASRDLHDMTTLKKLMNGYCVNDYCVNQIFHPMN